MNRLVLIGNGFDLAHGLKTSYADFIDWYWDYRVNGFAGNLTPVSQDLLCSFEDYHGSVWNANAFAGMNLLPDPANPNKSGKTIVEHIIKSKRYYKVNMSPFFERIIKGIETKGWVDIENEYYELLKQYALDNMNEEAKIKFLKSLNNQLDYLKELLIQYLIEISEQAPKIISSIKHEIYAPFEKEDMSVHANYDIFEEEPWKWEKRPDRENELRTILEKYGYGINESMEWVKAWIEDKHGSTKYPTVFLLPKNIMLLNFNYTHTAQIYKRTDDSFEEIHIHGDIDDKERVIFGYGDEMHSDFKKLKEREDGECLRNVKSIRYLEATNYKKVLRFIESAPFQAVIMGHSCGRSDRTLLYTIFEHPNCSSIKLCYYRKEDGTDDYLEKIQNISRNFVSMENMRDVVVPKPQCKPLVRDIIEVG